MFDQSQAPEDKDAVTVDVVKKVFDDKSDLIIDVRNPDEYAEGHIDGSFLLPLPELAEKLSAIPDKSQKLYIYCRRGIRGGKAAAVLKDHGYTDVHNMTGGIEAWIEKNYPTVK